jgi:hypothetical protein
MYRSKSEIVDLTKKLLTDSALREDIVLQSNYAIDHGFRWHHRFPLISQITGVDLTAKKKPGLCERYNPINKNDFKRLLFEKLVDLHLGKRKKYIHIEALRNYKKFLVNFPKIFWWGVLYNQLKKEKLLMAEEYD